MKPKTKKTKIMSSICNQVQLIGHLGADPEIKEFEGGKKVLNASIATNEYYLSAKGEKKEETQWHRVVAWDKTADIMQKLLKRGSEVVLQGKLVTRSYEDKSGLKKFITEVQVLAVHVPDPKNPNERGN
jgi:single-strand DNA-binding protein